MPATTSYELQTRRNGVWQLETTFEDKSTALNEARKMHQSNKHVDAVKVLEEEYDGAANRANTRLIFNKERNEEPRRAKKPAAKKQESAAPKPVAQPAKSQKKGFLKYLTLMVVSVAGIGLAIIALALYFEYLSL